MMIRTLHGSTNVIKDIIQLKIRAFKNYQGNKVDKQLLRFFQSLQNQLTAFLEHSRKKYYSPISNKLNFTSTNPKTHWSIPKSFLNYKKILYIPYIPAIFHENSFITGFKQKTHHSTSYFPKSTH